VKAVVVSAPGTAELVEAVAPRPRPGEVRVRVATAALCATDRRLAARGADPPRIPGHEAAGRLDDGTPVGIHPDIGCGRCRHCQAGLDNRCPDKTSVGLDRDGGLAEWLTVPAGHAVPLAAGPDLGIAPLLEPLACCLHALSALRVRRGEAALVVGAGTMGLLCMWTLQAAGARVAVAQRSPERRRLAARLGADVTLAPDQDPAAELGEAPSLAMVAAPGAEPLAWALAKVAVGGRVHAFASTPGGARVDANLVHYRHLTLVGSSGSSLDDYRRARDLVASAEVPLDRLPRSTVPLERAPAALLCRDGHHALKVTVDVEGASQ
jgi:L-iditol 2-dehydrogenase